jgi:nicotinate-nucleotide adenylyltransferase
MRIGCLFGTFDPPHVGHVAIAEHMRTTAGLDQVWLVVTPQNPFKHQFEPIIGSDNLAVLHKWKDHEDILEHHKILVYPRAGVKDHLANTIYHGHPGVRVIADAPLLPISSTDIRAGIKAWLAVDAFLPPAVLRYIREHRLYNP